MDDQISDAEDESGAMVQSSVVLVSLDCSMLISMYALRFLMSYTRLFHALGKICGLDVNDRDCC